MAFFIILSVVCGAYMVLNFRRDIHMLQQNSYRISRYWRWLRPHLSDPWRLVDVACLLLLVSTLFHSTLRALIVGVVLIIKSVIILRAKYKKPLVFTKRVWRIYTVTLLIPVLGYIALCITQLRSTEGIWGYGSYNLPLVILLLCTIFSWAWVIVAVWALKPVEKAINNRFRREAEDILRSNQGLVVVGITGSYGKTSTKHYLHRILQEDKEVLMTPGSFNTPLGVIRTIREQMKPHHEVFICEMGAKQRGDIKEICDIVHPQMGIITAVGPMHLETFRTMEGVQATKFELADALPPAGPIVVNQDFEAAASRLVTNTECIRYGVVNTDVDFHAENVSYGPQGSTFDIVGRDGSRLTISTRLLGECNISNLIAAVIIARRLGVSDDKIRYAASRIEQVEHRLNTKRTPCGVTIIDDAFNSNPSGAKMAVEVLGHFSDGGKTGKRIIVTPGMVELGSEQQALNRELGREIAKHVDMAVIVGKYNREALLDGLKSAGFPSDKAYAVDTFAQAQDLLSKELRAGDTVLYENDLPDSFK